MRACNIFLPGIVVTDTLGLIVIGIASRAPGFIYVLKLKKIIMKNKTTSEEKRGGEESSEEGHCGVTLRMQKRNRKRMMSDISVLDQ